MNKVTALEIGGKLWEKNGLERIYLNADACKNILSESKFTEMEERSLKKARTYFDVKTEKLISDVGTVRVLFNRENINCSKK